MKSQNQNRGGGEKRKDTEKETNKGRDKGFISEEM